MKADRLRIETIRAKDLHNFFLEYSKKSNDQLISPISRYRAESQSKNPYADDDDAGLLVAYAGDLCVGYQGIVPGLLRTKGGLAKVYWCTAAYVLPEFRKRMVAIQLIKKLTSLKKDIVLTGFDSVVADVFKGFHFQEIAPLAYLKVRPERLDPFAYPFRRFYRLQKKWPLLRRISESALALTQRATYPPVRNAFYTIVAARAENRVKDIRWREMSASEYLSATYLPPASGTQFERGPEAIQWMLANPWIRDGVTPTSPAYYFSETYDSFRYLALAIDAPDGKPHSTVVLSLLREKGEAKLKVLDLNAQEEDIESLYWLIWKYAAEHHADEVEMPARFDEQLKLLPFGAFAAKQQNRRYLCHPSSPDSPLAQALPALELALCDGDCAFT